MCNSQAFSEKETGKQAPELLLTFSQPRLGRRSASSSLEAVLLVLRTGSLVARGSAGRGRLLLGMLRQLLLGLSLLLVTAVHVASLLGPTCPAAAIGIYQSRHVLTLHNERNKTSRREIDIANRARGTQRFAGLESAYPAEACRCRPWQAAAGEGIRRGRTAAGQRTSEGVRPWGGSVEDIRRPSEACRGPPCRRSHRACRSLPCRLRRGEGSRHEGRCRRPCRRGWCGHQTYLCVRNQNVVLITRARFATAGKE